MAFEDKFEVHNAEIEKIMKELGRIIGAGMPPQYGFMLLIFGFEKEDLFYVSNAQRESMIEAMREFIAKHERN